MIALYIILGIVLFFALIFSLKIKVYLRLEDELRVRAGVGPVVLTLVPSKPKKPLREKDFTREKHEKRLEKDRAEARKKAEKAARKKAEKAEKDRRKKEAAKLAEAAKTAADNPDESNAASKIETILALVEFVLGELPKLASYFHTDIRRLDITVGGPDAAAVALNYGRICAASSLLLELLRNKTALRPRTNRDIAVRADFCAEKTVFRVDLSLKIRIFSFIRIGWHALVWFIGQKIEEARA